MTTVDSPAPAAIGTRRRRRWLLWGSLAVNVLLLSFICARAMFPALQPFGSPPGRVIEAMSRKLPKADAAILQQIVRERQTNLRESQSAFEQEMERVMTLLETPQVDMPALREAVTAAHRRRMLTDDQMLDVLVDALGQMSLEGRQRLAAQYRRHAWRRGE